MVGGDALLPPAGGPQGVAVAEPDLRLVGMFGQDPLIDLDRPVVFPDQAQGGGHQVAVAGVARILRQQALDLGDRLGGLLLAIEDDGVVVPRAGEAGRQFQAAGEEVLGIGVTAQPRAGLGQHPDRPPRRWESP